MMDHDSPYYCDDELEKIRKEMIEGNRRAQEVAQARGYRVNHRIAAAVAAGRLK